MVMFREKKMSLDKNKIRYFWEHGMLDDWHFNVDNELYDESLVREFWDNIFNFRRLFEKKKFSEDFLREMLIPNKKLVNRWEWMELTQDLSESFIEEFKDRWNWDHIFMYQRVSGDFIRRHKEMISDFVKEETDIESYL